MNHRKLVKFLSIFASFVSSESFSSAYYTMNHTKIPDWGSSFQRSHHFKPNHFQAPRNLAISLLPHASLRLIAIFDIKKSRENISSHYQFCRSEGFPEPRSRQLPDVIALKCDVFFVKFASVIGKIVKHSSVRYVFVDPSKRIKINRCRRKSHRIQGA